MKYTEAIEIINEVLKNRYKGFIQDNIKLIPYTDNKHELISCVVGNITVFQIERYKSKDKVKRFEYKYYTGDPFTGEFGKPVEYVKANVKLLEKNIFYSAVNRLIFNVYSKEFLKEATCLVTLTQVRTPQFQEKNLVDHMFVLRLK